jgi:hypothetical protein
LSTADFQSNVFSFEQASGTDDAGMFVMGGKGDGDVGVQML